MVGGLLGAAITQYKKQLGITDKETVLPGNVEQLRVYTIDILGNQGRQGRGKREGKEGGTREGEGKGKRKWTSLSIPLSFRLSLFSFFLLSFSPQMP